MRKPKAILFDLGDTIINNTNFNPLKGTQKILEFANNPNKISANTVQDFANELSIELNEIKDTKNIEISCRSFQKLIFETYGISFDLTPLELEVLFNQNAWDRYLIEGIVEFLDYLQEEGIRIAILSNSSFSYEALMTELREFEIEKYFEFVLSTVDYCIRKPDKRIFNLALNKFNLDASEVWYIGNSFQFDVIGANNANMQAVWLNKANNEPLTDMKYCEVKSYSKLKDILKELNNTILYDTLEDIG